MSTHFWFGGEDSPYLVKKSTRFDDASLSRAPQEDDPYQYGKTPEIASVTVETADGDIVSAGFSAVTYTGNGGTPQDISCGFAPDLVWIKSRTDGTSHQLVDIVRGPRLRLSSNNTNADLDASNVTAFNPDGFTVGESGGTNGAQDYVSWCWDAGDTTVTNNEGFITSQVRANQLSGFSIVSYTGDGDGGVNAVGHGLGVAPSLMIIKNRDSSSENWIVYSSELGPDNFLFLNGQDSSTISSPPTYLNSTHPNEIAISLGGNTATNAGGAQYIAYCWAESPTQSFGSYTGTAAEQTVDLGFAPAFVMVKSTGIAGDWTIYDTARGDNNYLSANKADAEENFHTKDASLTSTGFVITGTDSAINATGETYIYAAFGDTYSEPPVEQQTLQFTAPTSLDNDLKTELFAPGEIVSQDSAYLATTDTVTSIDSTAGYVVDNSLMFNGTDSSLGTHLVRTQTTQSDRRKFTRSAWIKPCDITNPSSNSEYITHEWSSTSFWSSISRRISTGLISFQVYDNGTFYITESTGGLSDTSAWSHVVVSVDTTQASASDRVKIYINGVSQVVTTSGGGAIPLNYETPVSMENSLSFVGAGYSTIGTINATVDGYLAEVQKVDGSALSVHEFGEYDANGRWVAKVYVPSVSTSVITGVTANVGITEQVPEGVTGDYSGILGVTPSDTSGTFAVFPDGGGTAVSKGTFYWANMTPGATITWYGTSSASNNIRNVVGDVDETTITAPGTSLGSFTLTVNKSSGSAKVDFNTDSNCYGITPGPGGTVLALTDDTDLDNLYVADTVSSDAATAVVSAVDIYALYDQNETAILSPAVSQVNTIANQNYFNNDINDSNKLGNKGFYVYDTNSITISYSGLSAGTNIGIVAGPASSGVDSLDLNFTVSGDVTQSGSVTFYSGSTLSGSKSTLPKQLNNLTTTGSSGSFTLVPALTSDNTNLSQFYIQWIEGMGSTTNIIAIDESAPSITTGGGTWSNGDIVTKNIPYGTNGFNLDFSDTSSDSALGTDSSGNGNDFTVNNLNHTSVPLPAADPVPLLPQDAWDGSPSTYAYKGSATTWTFTTPITVTSGRLDIHARDGWVWTANTNLGIVTLTHSASSWPGGGSYPGWYSYINAGLTTISSISVDESGVGNWTLQGMQIAGSPAVVGTQLIQITELNTSVISDSPTNGGQVSTGAGGEVSGNYCTINPLTIPGGTTYTNGNLTILKDATQHAPNYANIGVASGKFYWEITKTTGTTDGGYLMGVVAGSELNNSTSTVGPNRFIVYHQASTVYYYDSSASSSGNFTSGAANNVDPGVFMVAFDADNGALYVGKNGDWYTTTAITGGDPVNGVGSLMSAFAPGTTYFPTIGGYNAGQDFGMNFGQTPFAYPMPEGYKTLRTSNL